jgi:hypothetical protein
MGSRSIVPDNRDIRGHPNFSGFNNVLGVVYEAAYKYIQERAVKAPQDLVTFIPFDNSAHCAFLAEPVHDVPTLLKRLLSVPVGGGTVFANALSTMHATLQQVCNQVRTSLLSKHTL